jgi:hypothetical protein
MKQSHKPVSGLLNHGTHRCSALLILALSVVAVGCSRPADLSSLPAQSQIDARRPPSGSTATGTAFAVYDYGSTNAVYVYPPNSQKPSMKITKGLGSGTFEDALDSQDNLYVFSWASSNQCQVTMYSPPKYKLVRSIRPSGECGDSFVLEADTNLLFFKGASSDSCDASGVEDYSNGGKLLRTFSGFGTPVVATADTAGNVYVLGVTLAVRSGYCYQTKPRVYVYEPGATTPTYVITKGLKNYPFVQMATDSANYLYVASQVPNPKKGQSPAWGSIVAYAAGTAAPAYTIKKAPLEGGFDNYSQEMTTYDGQLYVVGSIKGEQQTDVYQEHSPKLAYAIKRASGAPVPVNLAVDHTGKLYVDYGGGGAGCSTNGPSLEEFAPGQKTPEYTICSFNTSAFFFAVAW